MAEPAIDALEAYIKRLQAQRDDAMKERDVAMKECREEGAGHIAKIREARGLKALLDTAYAQLEELRIEVNGLQAGQETLRADLDHARHDRDKAWAENSKLRHDLSGLCEVVNTLREEAPNVGVDSAVNTAIEIIRDYDARIDGLLREVNTRGQALRDAMDEANRYRSARDKLNNELITARGGSPTVRAVSYGQTENATPWCQDTRCRAEHQGGPCTFEAVEGDGEGPSPSWDEFRVLEAELSGVDPNRRLALELAVQFIGNPENGGTGDIRSTAETFYRFLVADTEQGDR